MKVRVFVLRARGYFGTGLTPDAAFESFVAAGGSKIDGRAGTMVMLPQGITDFAIDGTGGINWKGGEGESTRYAFDKKTKRWVDAYGNEAPLDFEGLSVYSTQ